MFLHGKFIRTYSYIFRNARLSENATAWQEDKENLFLITNEKLCFSIKRKSTIGKERMVETKQSAMGKKEVPLTTAENLQAQQAGNKRPNTIGKKQTKIPRAKYSSHNQKILSQYIRARSFNTTTTAARTYRTQSSSVLRTNASDMRQNYSRKSSSSSQVKKMKSTSETTTKRISQLKSRLQQLKQENKAIEETRQKLKDDHYNMWSYYDQSLDHLSKINDSRDITADIVLPPVFTNQ